MSEKFSLKWNDFSSNASKSFGLFRNEDYLHDVTLVCDDQKKITAHKLVLSASSEYFKSIFKSNKISNPYLCLEQVSSSDLKNILDYIYNGEVEIYQEHLDRFLNIAQRFKLDGLLGRDEEEVQEKVTQCLDTPQSFDYPQSFKEHKITKSEQQETSIQLNSQIVQPLALGTTDFSEVDERLYQNMERNSDGSYSCKVCSKTVPKKTHMKFHVETHMEGLSFPCNTCGKEFRTRHLLKNHYSRFHRMS